MSHFTYIDSPDSNQLKQGDILNKTDDIEKILKEVHPHYLKKDYKYFIVLTQSCDLVQRDETGCKAPYITVACVRPLETLLKRELAKYQTEFDKSNEICNMKCKTNFDQFLSRVLNNNEPEYFFLQEEPASNFSESCIAFLRLSISLKSAEHYSTCLSAKILELEDSFKAKLGWIVGNMYSRVGTADWQEKDNNGYKTKKSNLLNEITSWFPDTILTKFESEFKDRIKNESHKDLYPELSEYKNKFKTDDILFWENLTKVLQKLSDDNEIIFKTSDSIKKIKARIKSDPTLNSILNKLKY